MNRQGKFDARGKPKNRNVLDNEQLQEVKEAFNLFDSDENGQIDAREFKATLRALGFVVKKAELRKMLADVNKLDTGIITFEDFVIIMSSKMQERDSREEIMKVFDLFDDDHTGKISFRNLKRVVQELGENIPDEEIQEMIEEADRDGDGMLSPEEFYRVMKKRGDNPLDDLDSDDD